MHSIFAANAVYDAVTSHSQDLFIHRFTGKSFLNIDFDAKSSDDAEVMYLAQKFSKYMFFPIMESLHYAQLDNCMSKNTSCLFFAI